jgi:dimethylaniline monooxygenase (N-oxide forming)
MGAFSIMIQNKGRKIPASWNLAPSKVFSQSLPVVNDHIIEEIHAGRINQVAGLREVKGSNTIELEDGTTLTDVDTILFCTGYTASFSVLKDSPYDPTRNAPSNWSTFKGASSKSLPYLYQNIFSMDFPDSLATTFHCGFQMPVFQIYDLASMAVAQVWKGNSSLPSKEEMVRQADEYQRWICERMQAQNGTIRLDQVQVPDWYYWVNETAGTGLNENLGYGVSGWKFWAREPQLCNKLMWGIWSPHVFRLFDGPKRKPWAGARAEIESINRRQPQEQKSV